METSLGISERAGRHPRRVELNKRGWSAAQIKEVPISQCPSQMLLAQRTVGVDVLDINAVIADAVVLPGHS
jgi:hypothetical protein